MRSITVIHLHDSSTLESRLLSRELVSGRATFLCSLNYAGKPKWNIAKSLAHETIARTVIDVAKCGQSFSKWLQCGMHLNDVAQAFQKFGLKFWTCQHFYVPSHPENLDRSSIIRLVDVCLKYTVVSYTCVRKCMHGNMQMPTHPKHVASDNRANKCEQLEHWICCTRLNSFMLLLFGWGWCQWVACHDHLIETQLTQGATKVLQEIMGNYDNFLYKHGSSLGMEAIHAGCHLAREICVLMYPRVFMGVPVTSGVATKNGHQLELHNLTGSSWKSDRLNNSTSKDPKEQVILG